MNRILYPLLLMFALSTNFNAQSQQTDSLTIRIDLLEQQERKARISQSQMREDNTKLRKQLNVQGQMLDSLKQTVQLNSQNIQKTANEIGVEIDKTKKTVQNNQNDVQQSLQSKTLWGIIIALVLLCIAAAVYLLLHKRISGSVSAIDKRISGSVSAIDKIKDSQRALQEESVKLDGKMVELLDGQMKLQKAQPASTAAAELDHSLALKVADEIVRIETNLSRMDSSVKGYKQLSASLRRIKDNFLANGYEIVDMLGKPYNEGMRVFPEFIIDENLKEGERIITAITKPQINYNGELIQKAKITVSQNI